MTKMKWMLVLFIATLIAGPLQAQVRKPVRKGVHKARGYGYLLGARMTTLDSANAKRMGLGVTRGVLFVKVPPESEAATQGLKKDDVLTHWNGKEMPTLNAYYGFLAKANRGDTIKFTRIRQGKTSIHTIRLAITNDEAKGGAKVEPAPAPAPAPAPKPVTPAPAPGDPAVEPGDVVKVPPGKGDKKPPLAPKPTKPIKPGDQPVPVPGPQPNPPADPAPGDDQAPGYGDTGQMEPPSRDHRRGRLSPHDRLRDRSLRQGRGQLGLSVLSLDDELRKEYSIKAKKGVVVVAVRPGSQGAQAGFQEGDVILKVNGKSVAFPAEVSRLVRSSRHSNISFYIERDGKNMALGMARDGTSRKRSPQEI